MEINWKLIRQHAIILSVLALFVLYLTVSGVHCPIYYLLGIPCPTCGMTRAYISFFHGNFSKAMQYHPLFLLAPVLLFVGIHEKAHFFSRIPPKYIRFVLCAGGTLFVLVYIIRLLWFPIPKT